MRNVEKLFERLKVKVMRIRLGFKLMQNPQRDMRSTK